MQDLGVASPVESTSLVATSPGRVETASPGKRDRSSNVRPTGPRQGKRNINDICPAQGVDVLLPVVSVAC